MTMVLQRSIPFDPTAANALPGIAPLALSDWLIIDEAYAGQMARREALLTKSRQEVLSCDTDAEAAAVELLALVEDTVLMRPQSDFWREGDDLVCPDGRRVRMDQADPLATLGRLVQEDFCILQKRGDEHVLTGAILCFPASWTLSEKYQRPLIGIHTTVDSYTQDIAKRVQRLFDGVRTGRPLWRSNALWYEEAELHQPRLVSDQRDEANPRTAPFFRSEKQSILRLPDSNAVVFSIHTFVLAREDAIRMMPDISV